MTTEEASGAPVFPLPVSSDPSIVDLSLQTDAATGSYTAKAPGTARLMTTTPFCLDLATGVEQGGPCPVLEVDVVGP
ncbi:MAG TPA: hypothetical protein VKR30_05860 [Candidatus Limnocylindrales bacterium]|nr:hypothetical protein [Candidatus Limnocylindrales bacterium]